LIPKEHHHPRADVTDTAGVRPRTLYAPDVPGLGDLVVDRYLNPMAVKEFG
jgi:hypothetical protein